MSDIFNLCPQCNSANIEDADYDLDAPGCRCLDCQWEGDRSELVCAADEDEEEL